MVPASKAEIAPKARSDAVAPTSHLSRIVDTEALLDAGARASVRRQEEREPAWYVVGAVCRVGAHLHRGAEQKVCAVRDVEVPRTEGTPDEEGAVVSGRVGRVLGDCLDEVAGVQVEAPQAGGVATGRADG